MALLVFLTFLSLIVNQYVPVWMKDSEASHMNGAFGQFGTLKSELDVQVLLALANQAAQTRYVPVTMFAPVTLGVDGVPIFAGPTNGDLRLLQGAAPWTVDFDYDIASVRTHVSERASGQIILDVHNRYYVPQTLAYESGGVVRSQIYGQAVRAVPSFDVTAANGTVTVRLTLVSVFGTGSASGTGTDGVAAKLIGVDRQDYGSLRSPFWINHTTQFGPAWFAFFNDTLGSVFGITASRFSSCPATYCFQSAYAGLQPTVLRVSTPHYDVRTNYSAAAQSYFVFVTIRNDWQNNDPVVFAMTEVTVQHAFVNAGVGAAAKDVQA